MKHRIMALLALLALSGLVISLHAGVTVADKEQTVTGVGACAKCILKETKECQLTVTAENAGSQVTYYLTDNNVAKEFGNQLCAAKQKIKVIGVVTVKDGKHTLTPSKIELTKG